MHASVLRTSCCYFQSDLVKRYSRSELYSFYRTHPLAARSLSTSPRPRSAFASMSAHFDALSRHLGTNMSHQSPEQTSKMRTWSQHGSRQCRRRLSTPLQPRQACKKNLFHYIQYDTNVPEYPTPTKLSTKSPSWRQYGPTWQIDNLWLDLNVRLKAYASFPRSCQKAFLSTTIEKRLLLS